MPIPLTPTPTPDDPPAPADYVIEPAAAVVLGVLIVLFIIAFHHWYIS